MGLTTRFWTTGIAMACGSLCASLAQAQAVSGAPAGAALQPPGFEASFIGKTISPNETVTLTLGKPVATTDGQFAVVVGTEDVTANFRLVSPTQIEGVFSGMPLPEGTSTLRLYLITAGNQWVEVGQLPLAVAARQGVLSASGKPGDWRPSLILGVKSQPAESHSASATPPTRPTYADATLQGGLQTEHTGENWSLKSQLNVVGSSYQPEAINFASQGASASQIDIANYLVNGTYTSEAGVTGLSMGNVQAGTNTLLASGIGNRGVVVNHRFNARVDATAALQNGSNIVGFNNFTGLSDAEHRLATVTLGVEALERPGGLRLEATSFQGTIKPTLTTGIATLQDAEESRGWGLRAQSNSPEGSLRSDVSYARSTYTPKGDSTLNILPGPSTAGSTWYAELAYDLLKNMPMFDNYPLSLTAQARHEYSAFSYKSLGAGQASNYVSNSLGLNASLGVVTGQMQLGRRTDNVDNAIAFLKNHAPTLNLSLAAPLAQMIDSAQPPVWAPTASYTFGRNRNFADTGYIPFGQTLADLPDVKVVSHGLGLNWTIQKLNLSYQYSRNLQDNSQIGYELQDVLDRGHNITAAYQFTDTLSLNGGIGKRLSVQYGTGVERRNSTAQAGVNWLFGDRYSLTSNINTYSDQDSTFTSDIRVKQGQVQLLKAFDIVAMNKKLPGQWALSYTHSHTNSMGLVVRYQTLNASVSLSFF